MPTTAIVLPSCSDTCGCVPLIIEKFLDKQGFSKVIGVPVKYSQNDFLNGVRECAEKIIQHYAGKPDHAVVLCQNIPLSLTAILAFRAGREGLLLDLRILHEEPITKELFLLKPVELLQQLRIVR